jgi:hypothetical protein
VNCRPPEEGEGEGEGGEGEGVEGEGGEVEGVEGEGGEVEGVEVEGGEVVDGTQAATVVIRPSVEGPSTHWPFGWTVISKCVKKSTPRIGKDTAPRRNFHENRRPSNCKSTCLSPHTGILLPLGPLILGPVGGADDW